MSFYEAFAWTLLRSAMAAALAIPISAWLFSLLQSLTGRSRFWWAVLVFCPLFAPDLIVGYGYRSFELSLLHQPALNHCFYFLVLLLKFAPAAVVVRVCTPPAALSASALHCANLIHQDRAGVDLFRSIKFRGELSRQLPVFGIVFLLSMQEFEIASLLQIPAWTVFLFDAQGSGLSPSGVLRFLGWPVLAQVIVVVPLFLWGIAQSRNDLPRWRMSDSGETQRRWQGVATALLAALITWGVPLSIVLMSGLSGFSGVLRNQVLLWSMFLDLFAGLAVAGSCAVLALVLARTLARNSGRNATSAGNLERTLPSAILLVAALPGLLGTLAVSIVILAMIQQPPLTELRSTVWPMAAGLVVFLVPRAVLLTLLLPVFRSVESTFLSTLLGKSADRARLNHAASLKWWCECRPLFLVAGILVYWSLANLTAAAILCPPTIPLLSFDGNVVPLPVRLYRFIHQGRTAALSVMALMSVLVPFLLFVVAARIFPRLYLRIAQFGDRD